MKALIILALFFLAAIFTGCYTNQFGSYQEDNKYSLLSQQIDIETAEVENIERGILDSTLVPNKETVENLATQKKHIAELKKEREDIFQRYVTSTGTPDELTSWELAGRKRANIDKRERMALKKIENNIYGRGSAGLIDSVGGYKVIIKNDCNDNAEFKIWSKKGGDKASLRLGAGVKDVCYLIPDAYKVSIKYRGNYHFHDLNIDGTLVSLNGEKCFGYAYAEGF